VQGKLNRPLFWEVEAPLTLTLEKELIMTQLSFTTQKTLLTTAIIATLASVSVPVSAAPTLFDTKVTVQNAFTISNPTPLSFGTVFASSSAETIGAAATDAAIAAASNKLTLAPAYFGCSRVSCRFAYFEPWRRNCRHLFSCRPTSKCKSRNSYNQCK